MLFWFWSYSISKFCIFLYFSTITNTACLQSWGELAFSYRRRPGWEESTAGICRHSDTPAGRWEHRPDILCVSLYSCFFGFFWIGVDSTNVLLCIYRHCSCRWDSSAYSRDVLWSRPSVHTHHSSAAGMWPTGPENSRQVHPAESIPQQGLNDIWVLFLKCCFTNSG